jgi:hypothetical protein
MWVALRQSRRAKSTFGIFRDSWTTKPLLYLLKEEKTKRQATQSQEKPVLQDGSQTSLQPNLPSIGSWTGDFALPAVLLRRYPMLQDLDWAHQLPDEAEQIEDLGTSVFSDISREDPYTP